MPCACDSCLYQVCGTHRDLDRCTRAKMLRSLPDSYKYIAWRTVHVSSAVVSCGESKYSIRCEWCAHCGWRSVETVGYVVSQTTSTSLTLTSAYTGAQESLDLHYFDRKCGTSPTGAIFYEYPGIDIGEIVAPDKHTRDDKPRCTLEAFEHECPEARDSVKRHTAQSD